MGDIACRDLLAITPLGLHVLPLRGDRSLAMLNLQPSEPVVDSLYVGSGRAVCHALAAPLKGRQRRRLWSAAHVGRLMSLLRLQPPEQQQLVLRHRSWRLASPFGVTLMYVLPPRSPESVMQPRAVEATTT
jgi:hypothetical protein